MWIFGNQSYTYIIENSVYNDIKVKIEWNVLYWTLNYIWLWLYQKKVYLFKVEDNNVLVKAIEDYSRWVDEPFETYNIRNWKVCCDEIKERHWSDSEIVIDSLLEETQRHELDDEEIEEFIMMKKTKKITLFMLTNLKILFGILLFGLSVATIIIIIWCPRMILRSWLIWILMWFADNLLDKLSIKWHTLNDSSKNIIWWLVYSILVILLFIDFYYSWKYNFWRN